MNINIAFSRQVLSLTHRDAKKHYLARKGMMLNTRTAAWVYNIGRDHWEFHGPDDFYWHGRASNAYEARAKGWESWMRAGK